MNTPFTGKHILLGITGSIAAYKAAELASRLTQQGALVSVILTESARQFVTPSPFNPSQGSVLTPMPTFGAAKVMCSTSVWGAALIF